MTGKDSVKIGLVGCGTIGRGVVELFEKNGSVMSEAIGVKLELHKVADRDAGRLQSLNLPPERLTANASDILDDPEIDLLIELVGGIDIARELITTALEKGKYVVTANKDLIATHGEELLGLARKKKLNLLYEASVGGGIPLIRPLKQSLVADKITKVVGIVNGTTNYILTRMSQEGLGFEAALSQAQELGFAEPDPSSDIEGRDAAYKLIIMAGLAFGSRLDSGEIFIEGISGITAEDISYAKEIGYCVKLLAQGDLFPEGIALRVHPTLVPLNHPLASVLNEFNAVFVEGEDVGDLMFYGRGAGARPTATAILGDVAEAARAIALQNCSGVMEKVSREVPCLSMDSLENCFYLRFLAEDRAGVLAALTNIFGNEQVSLDMVIQKRRVGELAEIVLVTHRVREEAFRRALDQVLQLPVIKANYSLIRMLD